MVAKTLTDLFPTESSEVFFIPLKYFLVYGIISEENFVFYNRIILKKEKAG